MIPFDIVFDEPAWPELEGHNLFEGRIAGVAVLKDGTKSGKPSVAFRIEVDSGGEAQIIVAQTTARLFCTAAKAIMARHPDLFEGD